MCIFYGFIKSTIITTQKNKVKTFVIDEKKELDRKNRIELYLHYELQDIKRNQENKKLEAKIANEKFWRDLRTKKIKEKSKLSQITRGKIPNNRI